MKKKSCFILLIIFIQILTFKISEAKIEIIALVDNDIITNYDIVKESNYLKILNPELAKLNSKRLLQLSKQSLIRELIKKNEISKLVNLDEPNSFAEEYIQNLIKKLGYKNKETFEKELLKNKSFSFDQFKSKIKIELYWNDIIFEKYKNVIKIDEKKLYDKINKIEIKKKEYFLYEIVLSKDSSKDLKLIKEKIIKSINEIGFENTASLYSVSSTAKLGGKVGWVQEDFLSKEITDNIDNLKPGDITNLINFKNTYIILKIDQTRVIDKKIDKNKELKTLILNEKNKKLDKFSRIFFNKVKANYSINEK